MRRWMAAPLVFAVAAAFTVTTEVPLPQASAQTKLDDPVDEVFQTADGVQLRGRFHKSAKDAGSAPVVILLYPPGKDNDMTKGEWEALAKRLATDGFNVFRFDWRGHGKGGSDIKDPKTFWNNPFTGPWNTRFITGAPKPGSTLPLKKNFTYKDLGFNDKKYAPIYINDLAAARVHLDNKNDQGDLSTSSIYLIGSESTATIGLGWLAAEWNRPASVPTPNELGTAPRYEYVPQVLNGGIKRQAGADIAGAVWLSPSVPGVIKPEQVKAFTSGILYGKFLPLPEAPKTRDNIPMVFAYAEKDAAGKKGAEFFYNDVLVAKGDKKQIQPLEQQFPYLKIDRLLKEVKGAEALSGAALLGKNDTLKIEDSIVGFLKLIQQERLKIPRKTRDYKDNTYFIDLPSFGVVVVP